MTRETNIEEYLRIKVEGIGGHCHKAVVLNRKHFPDRTILLKKATIVFVETKAPNGKPPRPGQIREHERLRAMGFKVYVINTRKKVDEFIVKLQELIQ